MGKGSTSVCNELLGDLEQDQKRLEWMIVNNARVARMGPFNDYDVYWNTKDGSFSKKGYLTAREAIDAAIQTGITAGAAP